MRADFDDLLGRLVQATSRVAPEYFQLPIAEADFVYRERVYCYELYHQLRRSWDERSPYSLGGEVDKNGHPFFRDGPHARSKPDFLVHKPGQMQANLAIVEVKPATVTVQEADRDLEKLVWFCDNARYFGGIQVIYGRPSSNDVLTAIAARFREQAARGTNLVLLWHADAGAPPQTL